MRTAQRSRGFFEPGQIRPGGSTAAGGVVDYRLGKLAAQTTVRGRWLDCGSCDGEYTVGLRGRGAARVVGTDIDPARAAASRTRWRDREDVDFVVAAAESLPFPDGYFDGILLNEVLEHVADQERSLAEMRRVLAPGGHLVVFSPNRWFPFEGHGMSLGSHNIGVPVPLLPWLPRRLAHPMMKARNYWPHELRDLVAASGLTIVHLGYAFPLFGHYRWLPGWAIEAYQPRVARLERSRVLRRFGVSTFVLASADVPVEGA